MQPVPLITDADVERIVRRDYQPEKFDEVMAILARYGNEPWENGPARVRMAVLRLADGRFDRLQPHMDMAKRDFRDVVAYAEYPGYMREIDFAAGDPNQKEKQVIDKDWEQYKNWFERA